MLWVMGRSAPALILAVLAALAPSAHGATFSPAVRLPAAPGYWQFFLAPNGTAVAVSPTQRSAEAVEIDRDGHVGEPVSIPVPEGFSATPLAGAVTDDGRVAVALGYFDETVEPSGEPHSGPGCCQRLALASWRLGDQPGPARSLTAKMSSAVGFQHSPGAPEVVIGPHATTVLWTSAPVRFEEEGEGPTTLEEAFGAFGGRLSSTALSHSPRGIWSFALNVDRRGSPIAAWLDAGDRLRRAHGHLDGALEASAGPQPLTLRRLGSSGLSAGPDGRLLVSYLAPGRLGAVLLRIAVSRGGAAFSGWRTVARIAPPQPEGEVLLGAGGALLADWQRFPGDRFLHRYAAGSLGGPFGPSWPVPRELASPIGFVGANGETVVIYRDERDRRGTLLDAATARRGRPFGRPRVIDAGMFGCEVGDGEDIVLAPIPVSARGYALIPITCTDELSGRSAEYFIRYRP